MGKHALFICQNAIGDIITTLPMIQFIASNDDYNLDVLVNSRFADIFAANHNVKNVITLGDYWFDAQSNSFRPIDVEEKFNFSLQYDVVIDSMCVRQTADLINFLRPIAAAGIAFSDIPDVYSHPVPIEIWTTWSDERRTASDCFADVVRAWCRSYVNTAPVLHLGQDARHSAIQWMKVNNPKNLPIVGINPGAGSHMKRWPLGRYIELGCRIKEYGFIPLYIFGPNESSIIIESNKYLIDMGALIYVSQNSQVQHVGGLLSLCSVVVSNDCAIMHVSAALNKRTLAIFGPTSSKIWFPYQRPWNQVVERDVDCRLSCIHGCENRECLEKISVDDVLSRFLFMVANEV